MKKFLFASAILFCSCGNLVKTEPEVKDSVVVDTVYVVDTTIVDNIIL